MIRPKHINYTARSLSWLRLAVMAFLPTFVLAEGPDSNPASAAGRPEIVGDLLLRFNNCSNPEHKGPHTTFLVQDPHTQRMTELDVSGIDASALKPGRKVRVSGHFVNGEAAHGHGHAMPMMKADKVLLEEGAQGDASTDAGTSQPAARPPRSRMRPPLPS